MKQFEIFSLNSSEQQHINGGTGEGEVISLSAIAADPSNALGLQVIGGANSAGLSNIYSQSDAGHTHTHGDGHGEDHGGGVELATPFIEELLPYEGGVTPTRP